MYDIIIIGSGPAGLSAAIYAQRACLDTIVIEKNGISGGQVLNTWEVDNYPGFPGVTGFELSRQFREHANKLGARVVQDEVVQVELSGNVKKVVCEEETYEARCVILASVGGAGRRGTSRGRRFILRDLRRGIFPGKDGCRCGRRRRGAGRCNFSCTDV